MENNKAPQGTFTKIPNVLLDTCDLSDEAIMLFSRLLRQVGHRGGIFHGSIRKLASVVHVKRDKAHRNLNALKSARMVSTGTDSDLDISTVELHTDDLWELNTAYNDGIDVPRWTDLQEVLTVVRKIRQQMADEQSHKSDNLSEISDTDSANIGQSVLETGQSVRRSEHKVSPKNEKNIKTTEESTPLRSDLFTSEQNRIDEMHNRCVSVPPDVTDTLRKHWDALAPHIRTQEQMTSLFAYTARKIANKTDPEVKPGNLVRCLNGWQQEEKSKQTPWHSSDNQEPHPQPKEAYEPIQRKSEPLPVDMREWMIDTAGEFGGDQVACVNELEWCFQHTSCSEEEFYSKLVRAYQRTERSQNIDTFFVEFKQSLALIVESVKV